MCGWDTTAGTKNTNTESGNAEENSTDSDSDSGRLHSRSSFRVKSPKSPARRKGTLHLLRHSLLLTHHALPQPQSSQINQSGRSRTVLAQPQ